MTPFHRRQRAYRQRGEGKVGCIVSFVVLALIVAVGFKVIPILWTNNELKDSAEDLATRASAIKTEAIELQLRSKARDLGIQEAFTPGAIKVTKLGETEGVCKIYLKYKRNIDLYGVMQWPFTWPGEVNTTVSAKYMGGL